MDLNRLIERELNRAFDTVGNLAVIATFHLKDVTGFDYSTGEVVEENPRDVAVKVVVMESRKKSDSIRYMNLLTKDSPLKSLDLYDRVTVGGEDWTIGLPIVSNGSTQLIEIFKGL